MRQLSGHEAGFLYADTPQANANLSLLHIFDQATAAGGVVRFKSVLAHIERRLSASPLFRQRLQRVPLGLDHPYWVDDENFDLEYHVRHIALPKPGDWRQFCIQTSRIHARALDIGRPLWEAYVIEGLDSFLDLPVGSFALLLKTHLAAVGLQQLAQISALLLDTSAKPPADAPPAPWFADSAPGRLTLMGLGLAHTAGAPMRLAGPISRLVTKLAPAAAALASEMLLPPHVLSPTLPVTRFNSAVSPHRVFETRRFTVVEFESIRKLVPGASVDDAVLAVCGGALRRYLQAQGELPEGHSLTAIRPPAWDPLDADDAQAQAWRPVSLGTDLADPVRRLASLQAQASVPPDAVARLLGNPDLATAAAQAPAALLAWSRRLAGRAAARLGPLAPAAHCTIAEIPAPAQPLFLCGARLSYFSAILPISDGLGLSFAITRHEGRVVISPTSCRELMPDPEAFALCLRDSFQEYLALALAAAKPAAAKPAAPPKRALRKTA